MESAAGYMTTCLLTIQTSVDIVISVFMGPLERMVKNRLMPTDGNIRSRAADTGKVEHYKKKKWQVENFKWEVQ
ncbi:unnamed protein product [Angiostrongylus costaricensis]|uniref:Ovule protein n=1 Tax=Angiostrongylus costaricensis TaxID=334426 RepID=A0A0R3P9N6_ANGCS|nr:unnamed protein product [Angiostrongylus costaricensis]